MSPVAKEGAAALAGRSVEMQGQGQNHEMSRKGSKWAPEAGSCMVGGPPGLPPTLQAAWLTGCGDHRFIFLPQVRLERHARVATTSMLEGSAVCIEAPASQSFFLRGI